MRRPIAAALAASAIPFATAVMSAGTAAASPATPSERVCFPVSGAPGDVAIVNLTPVEATAPGSGQLVSSDSATPPEASNVNFRPGSVDPNVAVAEIGADGQVCFVNSVHGQVHVIADDLGSIRAASFTVTPGGAPVRRVDTRVDLGGGLIAASERRCFAVAGDPGDVAVVNLTPVGAVRPGFGLMVSSDAPAGAPTSSNVNVGPGTVNPNVAFAAIGADGRVCYANSVHGPVHLVADELGTIDAAATQPPQPGGAPRRVADTRLGIAGGMVVPSGRACFTVAGAPGDLAVVNLTPVDATRAGFGQLVPSGVTAPAATSNVNFATRTFDPNVAAAVIGADRQVCFVNSVHAAVHLVADHLVTVDASAYAPPSSTGTPVRVLDTRSQGAGAFTSTTLAPTAIDCLTSDACVAAVGTSPVRSVAISGDGATATLGSAPPAAADPAPATALECALVDTCFASSTPDPAVASPGATLHVTTNRGSTWTRATLPRAVDTLDTFTCASALRCLAGGSVEAGADIDGVLFATSNGGTSWTEIALPGTVGAVTAVDCPTGTLCVMVAVDTAAGGSGEPARILRSTDAGATWTTVSLPTGAPTELQCPSDTTCIAFTGGTSPARHVSVDGGVSWTASPLPSDLVVEQVECRSTARCLAVPGTALDPRPGTATLAISSDLFATWTTILVATGDATTTGRALDVSCSPSDACFVAGRHATGGGFVSRIPAP